MFVEGLGGLCGGEVDGDAECFEDIGGSALGGDGAVAVFGYGSSGGGGDERRGGGDVEGATGVAAGAAGVDEGQTVGTGEGKRSGGVAHDVDEASDFGGGFATGGECAEESRDFDLVERAGEDLEHEGAGLFAGEGRAVFEDLLEMGLVRHQLKRSRDCA